MLNNFILMTDSYKFTHYRQYPKNTRHIYSYYESREGAHYDKTVFFGLQYFIKHYLEGCIINEMDIVDAKEAVDAHLGKGYFNEAGWRHILNVHNGRLPLEIKAVHEGSYIPTGNVLMSVVNTDPECYWLTNYAETLLCQIWYACTVATRCAVMREKIQKFVDRTGYEAVDYKLHDFGYRGTTCPEHAAIGGAAHLLSFKGTDNFAGIELARAYYGCRMAGHSIPASEHSTITAWGEQNETEAFSNMLEQYPDATFACVSDSYNIWDACKNKWGRDLKNKVLQHNGVTVIRPDSGTPHITVLKVLDILGKAFGYNRNDKGYKVLDPHVRVIQGDGVDEESLSKVFSHAEFNSWSADNIKLGSGGGILQKQLDRDVQRFKFACSAADVNGIWRDVYKNPIGDLTKLSKRGMLALVYDAENDDYETVRLEHLAGREDQLHTVFRNGVLIRNRHLSDMRKRLWREESVISN